MILWNSILVGFKQIWSYKFRSLLTMLGITLGVSSLIAMSAMVNGMENGISTGVAGNIFSGGLLLPLNIAVGCVVACTMYALYTMFRRGEF